MKHELKIEEQFADAILAGNKTFEIRLNDRGYQKGDYIKFRCVDNCGFNVYHKINGLTYQITYVLSGWGLAERFVVFSIKEMSDDK